MSVLGKIDYETNPCRSSCQPNLEVCTGCGRDEFERANWHSFREEVQRLISRLIIWQCCEPLLNWYWNLYKQSEEGNGN